MSFTEEELEEFKTEALELLELGEKSLLSLDNGTSTDFKMSFDSIFRAFHNLKGSAGMMELQALASHTHALESALMAFKEQTAIPKAHIMMFLRGVDAARDILDGKLVTFDATVAVAAPAAVAVSEVQVPADEQIQITPPQIDPEISSALDSARSEFMQEIDDTIARFQKHLRSIEAGQADIETLNEAYREMHSLKGAAYLFGMNDIGQIAHAMESALDPVRQGEREMTPNLTDALYKAIDCIELQANFVKKNLPDDQVKALAPTIVNILTKASEQLPVKAPIVAAQTESVPASAAQPTPQPTATPPAHHQDDATSSIRVPVALLDTLMNLMGEMVLVRNQVLQFSTKSEDLAFHNLSQRLDVVTSELQGEMMKTRMQPIGNVLNKFHRVVRDLSQELGKQITLTLKGAETELDKSLLEAIKDPLTHIVRNSCDHGIEDSTTRRHKNKSEAGSISINSYHEGGQVVIEISDDGKGLNRQALINKAIEKNLTTEAKAKTLSDQDVCKLIFAPGFSTAAKVTNVSGRGVGMDVVKTNIEKIGGTVDLTSHDGQGTTIRLKIPLTLAIVPALLVKSAQTSFAIPQVKLVELVCVENNSKIESLQGAPVLRLRGDLLPLVDLNQVMNQPATPRTMTNIAVVSAGTHMFGLIVDEIQDSADIVVKPLNGLLKQLEVYSGSTILGDGSVALILDIQGLARKAKVQTESEANAVLKQKQEQERLAHLSELQDFILVKLNNPTTHAFVLSFVHRLEEFKRSELERSGHHQVIRYRGAALPIIETNKSLDYESTPNPNELMKVIVVERGGQLFGLEVDDIVDTLQTTAETNTMLSTHKCMIGNITTDKELIVVVDPFQVITSAYPSFNQSPTEKRLETQSAKSSGPANILLVEDSVFFKKLVRAVLEEAGHQITTASDGVQAVEILNRTAAPFDVIVSDIEMPRMNGFQLAAAVRANPKHANTKLVALSSRSDRKHQHDGEKAGFNIYLEKLKPEILLQAINSGGAA